MNIKSIICFLTVAALMLDCRKPTPAPDPGPDPGTVTEVQQQEGVLILTQAEYEVPAAGEIISITLKTNSEISYSVAEAAAGWIIPVTAKGLDETEIKFSILENEAYEAREGVITFTNEAGSGRVTVKQAAAAQPDPDPDPDPTPDEMADLECPNPPASGQVPIDALTGYAAVANVTGGAGASQANILHFNNGRALQTWLEARAKSEKKTGDHSPVTIWLSGTFVPGDGRDFSAAHPWFDVKEVSNLSFIGTDGFVMDRIGLFCVRSSNIIIRNLNFRQPKADNGADAVSIQACDGIWVDHCTFTSLNQTKDYEDGSCDITHASKNVTMSWCHFIKTQKSCLVGHSDGAGDDVAITATFHHNWFDGSSSRHPRVRHGRAHVYNNLYDGCTTYGAGSAYGARVLVEYNVFDGVQLPTDICTYPAKKGDVSNLTGSVAGYLYATQNSYLNRPAGSRDPYPLTNVEYKKYNGEKLPQSLTYADFKPAYDYTVTPVEDLAEVVKSGAGYGKLGYAEAPVEVNNGGADPGYEPGGGDQPGGGDVPAGAHTYTLSVDDGKNFVTTVDGTIASSNYFTYSTSIADFTKDYNGPFTIGTATYKNGLKMDSKGAVTFTTSSSLNTTVRFWCARRKSADESAAMQIVPEGGDAIVLGATPHGTPMDSGEIQLDKGKTYTVKQKTKEQGLILMQVTESE